MKRIDGLVRGFLIKRVDVYAWIHASEADPGVFGKFGFVEGERLKVDLYDLMGKEVCL